MKNHGTLLPLKRLHIVLLLSASARLLWMPFVVPGEILSSLL